MFDAPRELVWKCFTEPEHMSEMVGPEGRHRGIVKLDLRPGGICHYGMTSPDGTVMWGKIVYREIVAPERIVFINSFSDEDGGTDAPSDGADLAAGDAHDLHLRGSAGRQDQVHDPLVAATTRPPKSSKTFDAGHDSMRQGWTGTLDQLEAYLAKAG